MSETTSTDMEDAEMSGENQSTDTDSDINSAVSAITSFIVPGAGHLVFNDQSKRAGIIFVAAVVLDIVFFVLSSIIGIFTFGVGLILYALIPVVHLGAAYDAYNEAEKINMGTNS